VTLRDAYLAQTDLALLLTFTHTAVIGVGALTPLLQVWVPLIRLEGELPKSGGGSVISQSIDFTGLDDLVHAPIAVVYRSTDVAI